MLTLYLIFYPLGLGLPCSQRVPIRNSRKWILVLCSCLFIFVFGGYSLLVIGFVTGLYLHLYPARSFTGLAIAEHAGGLSISRKITALSSRRQGGQAQVVGGGGQPETAAVLLVCVCVVRAGVIGC